MSSPVLICRYSDDAHPYHIHSHLSCELIYIRKGKALFSVGNSQYTATAGTVVVISSLENHSVTILEQPYERYFLILSISELEKQLSNPRLTSVFKNRPTGFHHSFFLPGQESQLEQIFSCLLAESSSPDLFSDEFSSSLLKQLLILLYRSNPGSFPSNYSPLYDKILESQHYLERHFAEPISISQLSQKYFLNADYFSRSFREITGYSPKQYLMLHRLTYSCELLLQTSLQIQDISVQCGFNDVNGYIQAFKKQYHITPHQYRKNENEIEPAEQ